MHSNSYYNQQQRIGGTVPSSVEPQAGPDFDHCRMQPPGLSGSSSSTSTSSIPTPNLHNVVPGPRTNPHSYAAGYYGNGPGTLTRYHVPSSSDYIGTSTGLGPPIPPSTASGTTAACSTGLLRDDSVAESLRQPCRQGQVDSGSLLGGTSCQFSGTQHQVPRQAALSLSVDAWSSGLTSNQQQPNQQRINLAGYIEQAQHLHNLHQQQSQGTVWMAGCAEYRPQVTSTTHSQFPDSPPDSGSEPYSPPNDNRRLIGAPVTGVTQGLQHPASQPTASASSASAVGSRPPMYMNQPHKSSSYVGGDHLSVIGGAQYAVSDQSPGPASVPYCMSRGVATPAAVGGTNYINNSSGMYPTHDSVKQLAPPMMVTHVNAHALAVQYGSMHNAANHPPKKRKYSDSPPGTLSPDLMNSVGMTTTVLPIKPEPCPPDLHYGLGTGDCSEDESYSYDFAPDGGIFLDGTYQVIKWTAHQQSKWATLIDETGKDLSPPMYRVDADKGFNHAPPDDAFVCQKKNHFQITVHVGISGMMTSSGCTTLPKFIRLPDEGGVVPIDALYLHFYGIKMESATQTIKIEQSQSDRSKKPFHPVRIELSPDQVTKVTVGRLHFSETTSNNMRKKGKPNPDQRYFQLVVSLMAHCGSDKHMLAAQVSERIIVRASNPGQFENDMEALWNKGKTSESVYHSGRVGVNTDSPDEALTVHGNVKVTGHVISPSDMRAKKDIQELDTSRQLRNISQLKVYQYQYDDDFAEFAGLLQPESVETGVLAQQVQTVLPDAVRETGDVVLNNGRAIDNFLVVNKDRIFIENVGAVKELCKVTDKLENRITEIEIINKKLTKYSSSAGPRGQASNMKSTCSHSSISISTTSSVSQRDNKSVASSIQHSVDNSTKVNSASTAHHHRSHRSHRTHRRDSRPTSSMCSLSAAARDQALCTNRAIHISVIVLVAVMAVCLLSITVLYVVDRKVTTQMDASPVLSSHTQPSSRSHIVTTGSPTTSSTTTALLPVQCQTNLLVCENSCCAPFTPLPPNDPDHGTQPVSTKTTTKIVEKTTRSPNDVRQHFTIVEQRSKVTPRTLRLFRRHIDDNNVHIVELPQTVRIASTTTEMSNSIDLLRPPENLETTLNEPSPEDDVSSQDDYPSADPSVDTSMRDTVAVLYLKQLNVTVGSGFCNSDDSACLQQTNGNYTYSIPLSPRFPKLPVTIQFILKGSAPYVVSLCSQVTDSACSESSDMSSAKQTSLPMEWDLPFGFFQNSQYKFRIGVLQQGQEQLCSRPRSAVGNQFIEYNLNFYRLCLGT